MRGERLLARGVALILRELRLILRDQRVRRCGLCCGGVERRPVAAVVEPRQHLFPLDAIALFDQHRGERPGDLRRHRGLAARGDVAGRLQHRARIALRRWRYRQCRLHGCRPMRQGHPANRAEHGNGNGGDDPRPAVRLAAAILALATIYPQFVQ